MQEIDQMDMLGFLKVRAWNSNRAKEKAEPLTYNGFDRRGRHIGIGREYRERSRDPAEFRVFQGMG